ncbi:protein of unknown function [Pseudodesulfovibrio piezophilus C1TLV30]|uniref:Uncharacterized protein n=1 Tax=Pseudodesulfovibrio piezophilus (strain DSM 21447 / JCM 15486 / C1TLV30) TaxID=1322246 RepID=M1WR00_PSEP2|nr:protein of unknown function [Pseudodesulfovibrio piezophilus C1TLV30]
MLLFEAAPVNDEVPRINTNITASADTTVFKRCFLSILFNMTLPFLARDHSFAR